jgi:hypothetical protein
MKCQEELGMRDLSREEVAAMYVFHDEYAAQACGAIEFWRTLAPGHKRVVREMLSQLDVAKRNPADVAKRTAPKREEAADAPAV